MPPPLRVIRRSEVVPDPERWVLTEETVPESSPHDLLSERIRDLLLHAVRSPAGASFDLSTDEAGAERWLTPEEAERAAKEAARRESARARRTAEAERAAREAAERRVRELEALLARARS
ncbi:hypothetical protein WMF31_02875 [Sorangium sp. So ce1036]|uniref:hypothetical protein n=1 Tax=Sorangium sp. So ce1036 TaxID=3133328 RepID=UPI003EFCCB1F